MAAGSEIAVDLAFSEVATWATAAPGAGATWYRAPVDSLSYKTGQKFDNARELRGDGANNTTKPTVKEASASFGMPIHTGSLSFNGAASGADPGSCYMQKLLENYFSMAARTFGGNSAAITVASSSGAGATAPLKVSSSHGLQAGDIIQVGGDVRLAMLVSTNDITLDADVTTYTNGTVVYGGFNFQPTRVEYAKYLYFTLLKDGHSRLIGPARVNGFKIQGNALEGARYMFDVQGSNWSASGVTPTAYTDAIRGEILKGIGSPVAVHDGTSVAEIRVAQWSLDFGLKHSPLKDVGGTYGLAGFRMVANADGAGELMEYFDANRWTDFVAGTGRLIRLLLRVGSTDNAKACATICAVIPNAQFFMDPADVDGVTGQKCGFKACRPTDAQIANGLTSPIYFDVLGGEA